MKTRKDTVVEIDIGSSLEEPDDPCQLDSELVIDEKECMGEFVTDYAFDESELDGEYRPDERYVAGYSAN